MKILVIRSDNIGDLVLTTPVFTALRRHFPEARIEALVNSYNARVLEGHPDIDRLHVYTKAKHSDSRWGSLSEWSQRLRQVGRLRAERFDHVPVPRRVSPRQLRLAWLRPAHIAAFAPSSAPRAWTTSGVSRAEGRHHVGHIPHPHGVGIDGARRRRASHLHRTGAHRSSAHRRA